MIKSGFDKVKIHEDLHKNFLKQLNYKANRITLLDSLSSTKKIAYSKLQLVAPS